MLLNGTRELSPAPFADCAVRAAAGVLKEMRSRPLAQERQALLAQEPLERWRRAAGGRQELLELLELLKPSCSQCPTHQEHSFPE